MRVQELELQLRNQEKLIRGLFDLITRLEVLAGITEPPPEWNITDERIISIMQETGHDFETVRESLVKGLGEI